MPSLIVNVVGNTAPLEKSLRNANSEIASFSEGFTRGAAKAGIFAAAAYSVGQNLESLGGNAAKAGKAMNSLMTGNVVGFVKSMQSINATDPKKLGEDLVAYGNAAKATEFANKAAAAGWDAMSKSARSAALEIANVTSSLDAYNLKAAERIHDPSSPGAISDAQLHTLRGDSGPMLPSGKMRPGVNQGQRNQWFDTRIARALNLAQDSVPMLKQVAAELKKRIDVTKDITRQMNLEDQLLNVQRRIEASQTKAAKESARLAAEREAAMKARQKNRQMVALGLGITGVPNLKKQLAQLSSRSDIDSLPNKLGAALDGARQVLAGKWGAISDDSRSAIQSLFDTIRQELNKGGGRNLTATSTINSQAILGGLGLDRSTQRALAARLSAFNTGGTANAASAANAINLTMNIDGRPIEASVTKNQRKRAKANPPSRRG